MLDALLVTSAATLFESAPFILAAWALTRVPARWNARIRAYLGCGCGAGPSARSLPAAAATWLVFGPLVAGARLAAAMLAARLRPHRDDCAHGSSPLAELSLVLPFAAIGACAALLLPMLAGMHPSAAASFAAGAAAAFFAAPCALGAVGLAAALRAAFPVAAWGFLCIAGIADLRTCVPLRERAHASHDAFGYLVFAAACAVVAARGGGSLVHPKLALALWPCAAAGVYGAARYRERSCARSRLAPLVMLAGSLLAAPPPAYHATQTSLADAFAGERLDFTGMLTRTGSAATLVRYAITCCRADAAPIVVRLERAPARLHGWVRARGAFVARGNALLLRADSIEGVGAPPDPFVYR